MTAASALDIGHRTHPGQVRERNEDSYGLPPPNSSEELLAVKGHLYLVADGMGGHKGGQLASQMAAQHIVQEYYQDASPDPQQSLGRAIRLANAAIYRQSTTSPELTKMGTTVTAAVVRGRDLYVANVGDSRVYLVQGGTARQLTQDHSYIAQGLRDGTITPDQAGTHPYRGVITRALGAQPDVQPDFYHEQVQPGDSVLLCSDGLTNEVDIRQAVAIMAQSKTAQAAADRLVDQAVKNGGRDNVTVLVVDVNGYRPAVVGGLPSWLLPTAGGLLALVLVFVILAVFYRSPSPVTPSPVAVAQATSIASDLLESQLQGTATPPQSFAAMAQPPGTIAKCGDGICDEAESPQGCPADCALSTGPALAGAAPVSDTQATVPPPTWTPTPPATQTPSPTATPTRYPAPVLDAPPEGGFIGIPNVKLEWHWSRELDLGDEEHFDVRVWHEGESGHEGIAWADDPWHEIGLAEWQPGRYYWYIVVIRGRDNKMVEELSEPSGQRSFIWEGKPEPDPEPERTEPPPTSPPPTNPPPPDPSSGNSSTSG